MNQPPLLAPEPPWLPEVLSALAEHDYLALPQIAALTARTPNDLAPVIDRLVHDRQIRVLRGGSGSTAYALTLRGARLLAELTGDEPVPVGRAKSVAMLDHELVKNDLAVVLQLLDAKGEIELLRWETARDALADAVHLVRGTRSERVAIVADALAVIATPTGPTALLVEVDMGTVPLARMRRKYEAYAAWWRADGPERRFGVRALRMVTIANHETRLARLRASAAEVAGSGAQGFFWFGGLDALDVLEPGKLLGARFVTASPEAAQAALVGPPQRNGAPPCAK